MSLRALIFSALSGDSVLNGLGITPATTFITHDRDTPQQRPFMVLRWQRTNVGLGDADTPHTNSRRLQVWVHDKPGDYGLIDQALNRVRDVLVQLVGVNTGTTGSWIVETTWEGFSDDLRDDDAGTITRNGDFSFVGSVS